MDRVGLPGDFNRLAPNVIHGKSRRVGGNLTAENRRVRAIGLNS